MITIPILFSLLFLYLAFGPFKKKEKRYIGDYGFIGGIADSFGSLLKLLWLIPFLLTWVVYLGIKVIF